MERQKSIMERQKSMESGLLRKSLSIRERKHPNEDGYLETGLSSKRHKEVKKHHNEDGECCVTTSVCLITFIVVTGSFCVGCGVSTLYSFGFVLRLVLYDQNYIDFILIELDVSIWQTGYSSVAQHGIVSDLSLSVAEVSLI